MHQGQGSLKTFYISAEATLGSTIGRLFSVTTFGESHGPAVGAVIQGCPPHVPIDLSRVQAALTRRRPGQSDLSTPRDERDLVQILSGLFEGQTLGTPIAAMVKNTNTNTAAYLPFKDTFRPSHADFSYEARYGIRAWPGGGRASARETVGRVIGGAIAEQVLAHLSDIEVVAWVDQVGPIQAPPRTGAPTRAEVDADATRCPHPETAKAMRALIQQARREGDSVGGIIRCHVSGVPAGLGAPVFDKLEAEFARAMLSIPAAKGFESGGGYASALRRGSENNDAFITQDGAIRTRTNHSGGIQGGISNGMPITLSVAFKPVATLFREQDTVTRDGEATRLRGKGRHDPCVLPRAVPIVEAMAQIVLLDHLLRTKAIRD